MKDIKYTIKPIIHCKYRNLSAEFAASLNLTNGPKELSPTATQWELIVEMSINREIPPFDLIENVFKCFLDGSFSRSTSKLSYQQTKRGFDVLFVPEHLRGIGVGARREVRSVHIKIDLTYLNTISNRKIFPEVLRALNYGFTTIMNKIVRIAPFVFDISKCLQLKATFPLLRPIYNSLDIKEQGVLENVLEKGIISLQAAPHNTPTLPSKLVREDRDSVGKDAEKFQWIYFAKKPYQEHKFMVISTEYNCEHEPCFLDEIDMIDNTELDPFL